MTPRALLIAAAATLGLGPAALSPCLVGTAAAQVYACCEVCRAGKACGDSCIGSDRTCHEVQGYACDG